MASQRKVGVLLGYSNILVKNLVYLVYTPMLLHYVGEIDYGVYQSTNSFVFSLTLLTFGFSEAYVRFYMQFKAKKNDRRIQELNGTYLILYVGITAIAIILGLLFAANAHIIFSKGFTESQVSLARTLMMIMTFNIALSLFSTVFDAYIVAHERFAFQQTRQLFTTLMGPILSYLLLLAGLGAIGVAYAQLSVTIVLLVLNMRFAIKTLGMKFQLHKFDIQLLRAIAVFSAWIFANQLCELANQNLPNILLGMFASAQAVSIFAVAVQIRSIFYSLSGTIAGVFTPLINRIVAESDDNDQLTHLMTRVGRYQAMAFLWAWGGFIVVGHFFVRKWAGENFSVVYWMVLAMVTPLFIPLVQNTGIEIQRAKNRHKARGVAYLLMAVLNVAITIALSSKIGYWAPVIGYAAYVILGCGFFMNWYYHVHIKLNMRYFWSKVLIVIFVAIMDVAVCVLGTHYFPVSNWLIFIVWGVIYTVIYIISIFYLVFTKQEQKEVVGKLFAILKKPIQ